MEKHCYKIQLNTMTDVRKFIEKVALIEEGTVLTLTDGGAYSINAASIMGVLYSLEWNNLYLHSSKDVYTLFTDFII